ncbi:MAG: hypothetical protein H7839_04325 [Magnetococcus sp. YQC-5]
MIEIVNMDYSSNPWRLLIDDNEIECEVPIAHAYLGLVLVHQPIMGRTKSECTKNALNVLERLLKKNQVI